MEGVAVYDTGAEGIETYRLGKRMVLEVFCDEWVVGRGYPDHSGRLRMSERKGWYLRLTEPEVAALVGVYLERDAKED